MTRALLINENISGHATAHLGIRAGLATHPEIEAEIIDVPPPSITSRLLGVRVPGLAAWDLDLQPLRAQLLLSRWVARRIRKEVGRFDVLHIYSQNAALRSVAELQGNASVVSTDGSGMQTAFLHPHRRQTRGTRARARLAMRFERPVFGAATLVVAQSEWAARSLRDDYGTHDDRLRVIPFGVVVPEVTAHHEPVPMPEITWIGTGFRRKGGSRLLRVFREQLRERCILNLVTQDDVSEEPGVRVFSDIQPGDGQILDVLARTAILAFPSDMDTFGYVVLEAMAVGVPVVACRLHAMPELVADGVTGILIDLDDHQLAAALTRLIDDPPLRMRMGTAARQRVLDRFDARVTTSSLVDTLLEAKDRHAEDRERAG